MNDSSDTLATDATLQLKFIVDLNVGKLARWLRMIGYNTVLFDHRDDKYLIHIALMENRILLTRDTRIMQRRVITIGELKALLIISDDPLQQIRQVIYEFGLNPHHNPFGLCLECNHSLEMINKDNVRDRLPPYVYQIQSQWSNALIAVEFTGRVHTGRRW